MKLSPLIALGSASIITFDYDQTEYSTDQVVSLRIVFKSTRLKSETFPYFWTSMVSDPAILKLEGGWENSQTSP